MSSRLGVADVVLWSEMELVSFLDQHERALEESKCDERREALVEAAWGVAVSRLSTSELKRTIRAAGLGCADCYSKELLHERGVAAAKRLRVAAKLPDPAAARKLIAERRKQAWRCYKVTFGEERLGITLACCSAEPAYPLVVAVRKQDCPELQPGDELVEIESMPLYVPDEDHFQPNVLDRLARCSRPMTLTFIVGDNRWPPTLKSTWSGTYTFPPTGGQDASAHTSADLVERERLPCDDDDDDQAPPEELALAEYLLPAGAHEEHKTAQKQVDDDDDSDETSDLPLPLVPFQGDPEPAPPGEL